MLFNRLLSSRPRRNSPTRRQQRLGSRLVLETLEARTVLSTLFVGGDNPAAFAQIQAAVDAANPGDKILVNSGTYTPFTDSTDNLKIQEATPDANPLIVPGSSDTAAVTIDANGVTVQGLEVRGVTTSSSSFSGFLVQGDNNTLRDNTVSDNVSTAYSFFGEFSGFDVRGDNNTLSNNTASDNNRTGYAEVDGMLVTGVGNTLSGNTLSRNKGNGVFAYSDGPNTFRDNVATNNYFDGYYAQNKTTEGFRAGNGNTFIGNVADNNRGGFYSQASEGTYINNTSSGGYVGFSVATGSTLIGNRATNVRGTGFDMTNTDINNPNNFTITASGNVAENDEFGFSLFAVNSTLTGNQATGSSEQGFFLTGGYGNTLIGNAATDSGSDGFYMDSSTHDVLRGNEAVGSGGNGFYLSGGYQVGCSNNELYGNSAVSNDGDGFRLESTAHVGYFSGLQTNKVSDNVLQGNLAKENGGNGFHLIGSSGNTLRGNQADSNQGNGFSLETFDRVIESYYGQEYHVVIPSDNNLLVGNDAANNGGYGYSIEALANNVFQDNKCEGNILGKSNQDPSVICS